MMKTGWKMEDARNTLEIDSAVRHFLLSGLHTLKFRPDESSPARPPTIGSWTPAFPPDRNQIEMKFLTHFHMETPDETGKLNHKKAAQYCVQYNTSVIPEESSSSSTFRR